MKSTYPKCVLIVLTAILIIGCNRENPVKSFDDFGVKPDTKQDASVASVKLIQRHGKNFHRLTLLQ
ncbi:MAG: hypothetical protein KF746_15845 [Chitinophagaceae bacterium]|nr:hypothetical protein [Chitinophagaceae bacterium]